MGADDRSLPTATDELHDLTIGHAVELERYKAGLTRRMVAQLNASEDELSALLAARLERIVEAGYDAGPATTKRIEKLIEEIRRLREAAYDEATGALQEELLQLATSESEWQAAAFEDVVPFELTVALPTAAVLKAAVTERPFQGAVLDDWAEGMKRGDLDRIERAVRAGVVEGKTTQEIVRSIIGTRANGYRDGVCEISRRGADFVARTAVNHVVTQAREEVYAANDDIVTGVRWLSTLDGRTTLICISRDGQVFPIRDGPRPPAHPRCRSTTMPVIDGIALVGNRPAVKDTRTRGERETNFRADAKAAAGDRWSSMSDGQRRDAIARQRRDWAERNIGSAPKDQTYGEWLKRQPPAFQDDVLGDVRGQLFRDGGLSVDRFVDNSGRTLTLDELRRTQSSAFKRAHLN